jgi:hypothetical protein
MTNEKLELTSTAKTLLTHLVTTPDFPTQLKTLHNLALYESGDALLGTDEKQALFNCISLAEKLERLSSEDIDVFRSLIAA